MDINIDDIRRKVLIKYPTFGRTMSQIKFIEDDTCYYKGNPTAATDNEAVYYHPDFICSLNESQQVAVFAHEVAHIVLDHIERSKGKDPDTWNVAADAVINGNLRKDNLELVPGMIEREDALSYSEEELYEKIYEEKNQGKNKESVAHPHASHERWKDATSKKEKLENKSQDKSLEKQSRVNANELFKKAREQRLKNLKQLKRDLIEKSIGTPSSKNSKSRNISDLGSETKLVNWEKFLKDSCRYDQDWTYQNATIEYGVLTPHMEDLPKAETEILFDTSGSVSEQLLRNFLRECMNILNQSRIKVGCFDDYFYGFHEIRNKKDIETFPLVGGGGTDFDVAVNAFSKDADNKIIFTDGYASMPKKKSNVIWIVYGNMHIHPDGGKVIYISETELRRLNQSQLNSQVMSNKYR